MGERVSAEGEILRAPTDEELEALVNQLRGSGAEAVAISLLFSFANWATERGVGEARAFGSTHLGSHRILPEFREYERASTVVANAYSRPEWKTICGIWSRVSPAWMAADGGRDAVFRRYDFGADGPRSRCVRCCRARRAGDRRLPGGALAGFDRIIGFDMGGTSTDVFLFDAATGGPR